jgi:hypothetical protein
MYKYTTMLESAVPSMFVVWLWVWITVVKTQFQTLNNGSGHYYLAVVLSLTADIHVVAS